MSEKIDKAMSLFKEGKYKETIDAFAMECKKLKFKKKLPS